MAKKRTNKTWTIREIEHIKNAYPTTPAKIIANQLSTTEQIVDAAIRRYKIRKRARISKDPDIAGMQEHIQAIRSELGLL